MRSGCHLLVVDLHPPRHAIREGFTQSFGRSLWDASAPGVDAVLALGMAHTVQACGLSLILNHLLWPAF